MIYYLYVLLSVLFLSVNFCLTKVYQRRLGTGIRNSLVIYMITTFLLTAMIHLYYGITNGFELFHITSFSLICSILLFVFGAGYALIGFRIIAISNVSTYTLFLMVGGMSLPYFFGLIFLGDDFSILRMVGLVVMIVSIVFVGKKSSGNSTEKKVGPETIILCTVVFFLNGGVSIVSKIHQLPENANQALSTMQLMVLNSIVSLIGYTICFCVYSLIQKFRKEKQPPLFENISGKKILQTVGLMTIGTAFSGLSSYLNLIGAVHLPATVLYPMITGGSITLTVLCEWLIFKEKPSKRVAIGALLCFVATLSFL